MTRKILKIGLRYGLRDRVVLRGDEGGGGGEGGGRG